MKIVDSDDILNRAVPEVVSGAMGERSAHPGTGEPASEPVWIMVPSLRAFLKGWHASELGAPHHQRVTEEPALLEVVKQTRGGTVEHRTVEAILVGEFLVTVPVAHPFSSGLIGAVEKLDEADALLDEPARENAVQRIGGAQVFGLRAGFIGAVKAENVSGFAREIGDLGHGQLHAGGEFVAGDTGGKFRITRKSFEMAGVELLQKAARGGIAGSRDDLRSRKIADRLGGVECCSLKSGGEKAGRPVVDAILRFPAGIRNGDIRGKILVCAPQCVSHPGAHARKAVQGVASRHEVLARTMGVGLALHRMNEAEVVHMLAKMRQKVRHHFATFTAGPEFPGAAGQRALFALKRDELVAPRQRLAVAANQFGFVVKSVELAARAAAKDHQNILCPRRNVRRAGGKRSGGVDGGPDRVESRDAGAEEPLGSEQMSEGNGPEAQASIGEERPSVEQRMRCG